jgi:membrane-bound lytic murein transglycosylase B
MRAADDIANRRGLDPAWVRQAIGQARLLPQITRWVLPAPAGTPKNWRVYRSRFIDPVRIAAGVAFWQANAATLERAEREFGVPAEIIVGIIGVETIYGQNVGNFRVIDALATLSFDFPDAHPRAAERRAFFQNELEQLLSLAQRTDTDPTSLRGSYAGAMGLPQFMPSSWVRYAIDFDGDGRVDLFKSPADVIGSVANYFKGFGWQNGMPTHYPVQLATRGWTCRRCWRPISCPVSAPQAWPPRARCWTLGASSTTVRWRWSSCRMVMHPRCTWPAPKTSMPSRATTGAVTTPWP